MVDFTSKREIDRTPAEVFAYVSESDQARHIANQHRPRRALTRTVRCTRDPESGKSTARPAKRRSTGSSQGSPSTNPIAYSDCPTSRVRPSVVASRSSDRARPPLSFPGVQAANPSDAPRRTALQIHPRAQLPALLHRAQTRPRTRWGPLLTLAAGPIQV